MKLKASILQGICISIGITSFSVSCTNDSTKSQNNKTDIQLKGDSNQQSLNNVDTNIVPNVEFDACLDCGRG